MKTTVLGGAEGTASPGLAGSVTPYPRDARTRTRHLTRNAALLAHSVLKLYLVRRVGNLVVSTATDRAEEKRDGKFLLSCTYDTVTAADAAHP